MSLLRARTRDLDPEPTDERAAVSDESPTPPDGELTVLLKDEQMGLPAVTRRLDELATATAERASYERSMDETFRMLYADLQEASGERVFDRMRPIYLDVIMLFDRLESLLGDEQPSSSLTTVRDELLEILARQEVHASPDPSGRPFDPALHRAVAEEPAPVQDLDGVVHRTIRPGFTLGPRIVRYADVIVFRAMERGAGT